MLRANGVLLLGVACAVFGYGTHADACGATDCSETLDVLPADGSANVPLNSNVRVRVHDCGVALGAVRLQPPTGAAIVLSGEVLQGSIYGDGWFIGAASEQLAPNTRYEVQRRLEPAENPAGKGSEWFTVSSFDTGASADHEAPSFAGITALAYGDTVRHWSDQCGSSRDVVEVEPRFEAATDTPAVSPGVTAGRARDGVESPALRYNVYLDGVLAVPYFMDLLHDPWGEIVVDCAAQQLQIDSVITTASTIEVRAVDLAGNESPAHPALALDLTCSFAESAPVPTTTNDPALPGLANGDITPPSASNDDATPSISRGPGCALPVHDPSTPSPLLWPLLALLVPTLRRLLGQEPIPGRRDALK